MRPSGLILSAISVIMMYFLGSNKLYITIVALLAILTAAVHMYRTDQLLEAACDNCPTLDTADAPANK